MKKILITAAIFLFSVSASAQTSSPVRRISGGSGLSDASVDTWLGASGTDEGVPTRASDGSYSLAASGASLSVGDGSTTVENVATLNVASGFAVTETSAGVASVSISQPADRLVTIGTDTILSTDGGKIVRYSVANAVTLPAASGAGFTQGFGFTGIATGTGAATITPAAGTINGAASFDVLAGLGCAIYSDSTNYLINNSACPQILLSRANTWTEAQTVNGTPAASRSAIQITEAPYSAGSTSTNFPVLYLNSTGAAAATLSTSGTMFSVNAPSGFGGRLFALHTNGGSPVFQVNSAGFLTVGSGVNVAGSINLESSGALTFAGRYKIGSSATGALRLGNDDSATPTAIEWTVQNVLAGTADTAGIAWTLNGSQGTGTGVGGNIVFKVALPAGSTATTKNAEVEAVTISGTNGSATFAKPPVIPAYAVDALPAGATGMIAFVNDQSTACPANGVAPTDGGAIMCLVFYNGAAWVGI